jgi:hypothetical protein
VASEPCSPLTRSMAGWISSEAALHAKFRCLPCPRRKRASGNFFLLAHG